MTVHNREYSAVCNRISSTHKEQTMHPLPRFVLTICAFRKKMTMVLVSTAKKPFVLLREEWISSRSWSIWTCVQGNNFQYRWRKSDRHTEGWLLLVS